MSIDGLSELLIERLKKVGSISKKIKYGRVYVPSELIGEYIT